MVGDFEIILDPPLLDCSCDDNCLSVGDDEVTLDAPLIELPDGEFLLADSLLE